MNQAFADLVFVLHPGCSLVSRSIIGDPENIDSRARSFQVDAKVNQVVFVEAAYV
ncbi:MAG: hypothetical protein R3C03_00065 [Pirellulaceae bacterium]